jgi:hypothetical protein
MCLKRYLELWNRIIIMNTNSYKIQRYSGGLHGLYAETPNH